MSKTPRPASAPAQTVDPREAPGSYLKTKDGYVLAEPVTAPAVGASEAAPAPVLPAESAAAIAEALADIGHEAPAFLGVDLAAGPDLILTTQAPASDAEAQA